MNAFKLIKNFILFWNTVTEVSFSHFFKKNENLPKISNNKRILILNLSYKLFEKIISINYPINNGNYY